MYTVSTNPKPNLAEYFFNNIKRKQNKFDLTHKILSIII